MKTSKPLNIFVTGASGFVGTHLVTELRSRGHSVHAPPISVLDWNALKEALENQEWDVLIHLAAISHVPTCEKDPKTAFETNVLGSTLFGQAALRFAPKAHWIFPSTALVYQKLASPHSVLTEDAPIAPQNVYAQTKRLSECLLTELAHQCQASLTILRLFNHTHKTQPKEFFLPYLYHQLLSHPKDPIPVGNLDLLRDLGSVQDLLSGLILACEAQIQGRPPVETYNLCSGSAKSLKKIASTLAKALKTEARFEIDPSRVRKNEPQRILGSHQKFANWLPWTSTCRTEADLVQAFLSDIEIPQYAPATSPTSLNLQ